MSKWEDQYNELKSKIDNMIEEQDTKMSEARKKQAEIGKEVGSSEYKEQKDELKNAKSEKQRLENLKKVMPKIDNIIEYRDGLKKQLDELKRENAIRTNLEAADKKMKEAEKKIDELQVKAEEISKKLKNPKITEEERLELKGEQNKVRAEMSKAQINRQGQEDVLKRGLGEKRALSNLSKQELETKILDTQNKVSKCNFVAHNLFNGLSWEEIDLKLDNWKDKKFTSKDGKLEKDIKAKREEKVNEFMENFDLDLENGAPLSENNKPALTFEDKHPFLAKVSKAMGLNKLGKFIKSIPEKVANLRKKEVENDPKSQNKETHKKDDSFKEYIKYVAEHGKDAERKRLEDKFDRHSDGPKVKPGFKQMDETAKSYNDEGR